MKYLLFFTMFNMSLFGTHLQVGEQAPNFSLNDQNGKKHQLEDYKGKNLVIYFFPKAFTPGWTKQACGLRDESMTFKDLNISILGISYDSQDQLKSFKEKYNLPFDFLSDSEKLMGSDYFNNLLGR